ncbi:MAG: DUF3179 domain-containing protein [Pseudomonadota bacterium]
MTKHAAFVFFCLVLLLAPARGAELTEDQIATLSRQMIIASPEKSAEAQAALVKRGKRDVIAAMMLALRFRRNDPGVRKSLEALTGESFANWKAAMEWQELHPEIVPHASHKVLKLDMLAFIDPNFLRFLGKERGDRKNMDIRLEEVVWGGVKVDGIPSLDNPKLIPAPEADYLLDTDLVFGVEINGDARAYPLRIMGWHEMFNETIGGMPVALAYCTLCGAGILFETQAEGREKPFVFASSGLLYRSNKLMFDRETDSLWNQFTGEPVAGPLRGSSIKLKIRPVAITSWAEWKAQNPETSVLSLETGFRRNYGSGVVYKAYFESPDLMFPSARRAPGNVKRKDYVFGIRGVGAAKAWPVSAFHKKRVINDSVGSRNVVLIGDAATRTVRAYDRGNHSFETGGGADSLKSADGTWTVAEDAISGPGGEKLARVPGHISYWFAWDSYLGVKSELYSAP